MGNLSISFSWRVWSPNLFNPNEPGGRILFAYCRLDFYLHGDIWWPCNSTDIFYCFFVLCVLVFEHVKCFCKLCLEHAPKASLLLASPRPKLKNGRLFLLALPTGVGYFRNVTNKDAVFVLLVGARYYLLVVERQGHQLFPPWCCSCGTWRHQELCKRTFNRHLDLVASCGNQELFSPFF